MSLASSGVRMYGPRGFPNALGERAFAVVYPEVERLFVWGAEQGFDLMDLRRMIDQCSASAEQVVGGRVERGEVAVRG